MRPVPRAIRHAAEARLAGTVQEQVSVARAVQAGRPLDAEDDPDRKRRFIARQLGVSREIAARIAAYDDPSELPLSPEQRAGAESLQGKTIDFVSIRYLDLGRAASRSVARVVDADGDAVGTGFLIAPGLFLTNNHVVESPAEARTMRLEFNYEEDAGGRLAPISRFRLDPDTLFLFDDVDDLDFTLVAVGARIDGPARLAELGFLPLLDSDDKHIKAQFVNVIQHPDGRPKQLVTRESRIFARTGNTLIYGADTLPGSSGAPIFNDAWEVVALHHWGGPYRARRDDLGRGVKLPALGNEGIRISAIVAQLRRELPRLDAPARDRLGPALDPPFRGPSLAHAGTRRGAGPEVDERLPDRDGDPGLDRAHDLSPRVGADGTLTFTVPLSLSLRLGDLPAALRPLPPAPVERDTAGDTPVRAAEAAVFKPDPHYDRRRGYNPRFLGLDVPLPAVADTSRGRLAKNLRAGPGDDPHELKYHHFSVVMNATRRLAYFTAVNIDGRHVVRINRKTGQILSAEALDDGDGDGAHGAEAREKWYDDDRIGDDEITDQSLYDDDALADFQRGHLVKRTDPSWGAPETALKAQADTYHFTNCAPQHERFNPIAKRWAGLENWITDGSDDEDLRVTVLTGPIFGRRDPRRGSVRVPLRYWKVVARVEQGRLLATAAIADQTDLVRGRGERARAEDLPAIPALVKVKQVAVATIERLTGLDFGVLRHHDTLLGSEALPGPEALAPGGASPADDDLGPSLDIDRFADYRIGRPTAATPTPEG